MSNREIAQEIAGQLAETNRQAFGQIERMLERIGEEKVRAWVAEALRIEATGGMLNADETRRRSVGGIFFYLARQEITETEDQRYIWPRLSKRQKRKLKRRGR